MRASRAITLLGTAFSSRIYMMTFKYHPRQQNSRRYICASKIKIRSALYYYTSKIEIRSALCIENQNSISSMHRKSKFDQLYIVDIVGKSKKMTKL